MSGDELAGIGWVEPLDTGGFVEYQTPMLPH
jgi:hypothetical protein